MARFEPEIYRGEKELRIKLWWWEAGVVVTNDIILALERAFEQLCKYLDAESVAREDF